MYMPLTPEMNLNKIEKNVDHPVHYKSGNFECIDVMLDIFGLDAVKNFCMLNAFKYIWRSEKKSGTEDISKAQWYLNKYLELLVVNE